MIIDHFTFFSLYTFTF